MSTALRLLKLKFPVGCLIAPTGHYKTTNYSGIGKLKLAEVIGHAKPDVYSKPVLKVKVLEGYVTHKTDDYTPNAQLDSSKRNWRLSGRDRQTHADDICHLGGDAFKVARAAIGDLYSIY